MGGVQGARLDQQSISERRDRGLVPKLLLVLNAQRYKPVRAGGCVGVRWRGCGTDHETHVPEWPFQTQTAALPRCRGNGAAMGKGEERCDVMVEEVGAAGSSAQAEGTPSDDGGPQPNVWGALTKAEDRKWRVWKPQKGSACGEPPKTWTKQTPEEMPEALGLIAPAGQWLRSEVGSEHAWRDGMETGAVAQVVQLQVDIGAKRGKCDHRDTEIRILRMPSATQDHMCGVVAVAALSLRCTAQVASWLCAWQSVHSPKCRWQHEVRCRWLKLQG